MTKNLRPAIAGLALILAACGGGGDNEASAPGNTGAAITQTPPPAGTTWAETVTKTPEGGFLMGNPAAKVKLVEYASFTCHICAEFAEQGIPTLRDKYVASGQVSVEFRQFARDPIDVAAGLLMRCQGAAPHAQLSEQFFAQQPDMLKRFETLTEADQNRIAVLPKEQQFAELAKMGGMDAFFRTRGLPAARQTQCYADAAALDEIVSLGELGRQQGVSGTPMFLINGELVQNASNWTSLEPLIQAALAR